MKERQIVVTEFVMDNGWKREIIEIRKAALQQKKGIVSTSCDRDEETECSVGDVTEMRFEMRFVSEAGAEHSKNVARPGLGALSNRKTSPPVKRDPFLSRLYRQTAAPRRVFSPKRSRQCV